MAEPIGITDIEDDDETKLQSIDAIRASSSDGLQRTISGGMAQLSGGVLSRTPSTEKEWQKPTLGLSKKLAFGAPMMGLYALKYLKISFFPKVMTPPLPSPPRLQRT